jgi:hypothetical protein
MSLKPVFVPKSLNFCPLNWLDDLNVVIKRHFVWFFWPHFSKRIPLPLKLQQGDSFFSEFSIYLLVKLLARPNGLNLLYYVRQAWR